jgi:hypothetical protein
MAAGEAAKVQRRRVCAGWRVGQVAWRRRAARAIQGGEVAAG